MQHRSVFFSAVSFILVAALTIGAGLILPDSALAGPPPGRGQAHVSIRGGGHGHGHGGGHNTNVNVNVNGGAHHGGPPPHHDDHHHHHDGVGGIVAGAVTGLAVGAMVAAASMPSGCTDVVVGGISYRQCGSSWYQPCYQGTTVQYVVAAPPR